MHYRPSEHAQYVKLDAKQPQIMLNKETQFDKAAEVPLRLVEVAGIEVVRMTVVTPVKLVTAKPAVPVVCAMALPS